MMNKTRISDLAIFGGPPLFSQKLHVGRPNIGDRKRLMERIDQVLDTRWLSNDGPFVAEFESRISDYVGVKHCVAMCNATIALEIAIKALGLSGEVIIPSFTFVATAHALQWQEITPVFCDIDPKTHNIDPARVEELITPRTTGIIGVHLWGRPCEIESLQAIASRHNLKLLFDSAHAFGCSYKGQMVGKFGDAEVFSFHATKFMNSAEGGAVVTNDAALARKIRLMKNFGFTNYDEVGYVGTNGKMSELSAAVGLTNLESVSDVIDANRRNYDSYRAGLAQTRGLEVTTFDPLERFNYQYVVVTLDPNIGISRDELQQVLWAENVLARRYFYPGCHRLAPYSSENRNASVSLPETEKLTKTVLTLPSGTSVTTADIEAICETIRFVMSRADKVGAHLKSLDLQASGPDLAARATSKTN